MIDARRTVVYEGILERKSRHAIYAKGLSALLSPSAHGYY
jgi:hypothetical protein